MSSPQRIPGLLPARHVYEAGQSSTSDANTGGYDFTIGGFGFRLATDQNNPYLRGSEPTTVNRFDTETEPGEQSLSKLPWIKSQSSFHAGAGQLNLEHGRSTFEYQQEQIDHVQFALSQGVDPWTPGVVKRLPDTEFSASFANLVTGSAFMVAGAEDRLVVLGAFAGGGGLAKAVTWPTGKATDLSDATIADIDMTVLGGTSNIGGVYALTSDGANYYAAVSTLTPVGGNSFFIIRGPINNAPAVIMYQFASFSNCTLGFVKARLMATFDQSVYELDLTAAAATTLPTAKYTYPSPAGSLILPGPISESPDGVLVGFNPIGNVNQILKLTLDTSGGTPTLTGGAIVAQLPPGEILNSMFNYLGSYLVLCTSRGLRVCTFDSFNGNPQLGPLTLSSDTSVGLDLSNCIAATGRDRFVYATSKANQPDGQTGLVRVDLSMPVDTTGRNAWAPDLRPPTTDPDTSDPYAVAIFPMTGRLVWLTYNGLYFQSTDGPGSDGDAWLRTSRIRYDTAEPKLFKQGRVRGALDQGDINVIGIAPYGVSKNLGTFRVLPGQDDPGEFRLPTNVNEWIQLEFHLLGSASELWAYQAKAYPAPTRQHVIQLTALCYVNESDKDGLDVTDPTPPRQRYENVKQLEAAGNETRLVEFTNAGSVATVVMIDQIQFASTTRPTDEDDFGGLITFRLRQTEG